MHRRDRALVLDVDRVAEPGLLQLVEELVGFGGVEVVAASSTESCRSGNDSPVGASVGVESPAPLVWRWR